jgi:hypothetical protein
MTMATRVRDTRWAREPVALPYSTIGEKLPTALAQAAVGQLPKVAAKMGRGAGTLFKWAEGERGPEADCAALFPALRAAGIPRARATLLVARIQTLFLAAYGDELPALAALDQAETLAASAENQTQMARIHTPSRDAKVRNLQAIENDVAILETEAARLRHELTQEGL